jgi:hypothetical protein
VATTRRGFCDFGVFLKDVVEENEEVSCSHTTNRSLLSVVAT